MTTQLDERVRILLDAEAERREVGRIDPDNALSEDEAEGRDQPDFALAELREYVRAGVQMVFEELAPRREAVRDKH